MLKTLGVLFLAAFLAVAWGVPSVQADPPPWAPAHGLRAKRSAGGIPYALPPGIAKGTCQRNFASDGLLGGALGAAVGGLLGSKIGGGSGKLAATAAGTLLGALVGGSIGRSMDALDQHCVAKTLEYAPEGETIEWRNPDANAQYAVTPTKTVQQNDRYCREYQTTVTIGGEVEEAYGTACRQPDGSWEIVG